MIRWPRTKFANEGLVIMFTFFRITRKIIQFGRIIVRNENSICRENFSSWRFDSGTIFKIIFFSCGPQTSYRTAKSMENCPWPKNRRLCPTKNDVRFYTGILLKIEENICSRMLQDSIWIKWLEF